MPKPLICLLSLCIGFVPFVSAFAAIQYHFKPGVKGQVQGLAQFAEVSPESGGPEDYKVRVSGALVGSAPSVGTGGQAYLGLWGLGVKNPNWPGDANLVGQQQVDGSRGGEYLRLEFPTPVQLTLLTFASAKTGDNVTVSANGKTVSLASLFNSTSITAVSGAQGLWPGKIDLTKATQSLGSAKVWEFAVPNAAYGDGVQLENVHVLNGEIIPEPSALIVWGALGFAGFGIRGIRRRFRGGR